MITTAEIKIFSIFYKILSDSLGIIAVDILIRSFIFKLRTVIGFIQSAFVTLSQKFKLKYQFKSALLRD